MIDLHMHTNYIDGEDSVIEILRKCEEIKLNLISITDHDVCEAYNELKNINIKNYFSGKIITGIELNALINNNRIEILGYNYDLDYINNYLKNKYKNNHEEVKQISEIKQMKNKCEKLGIKINNKEFNFNKKWSFRFMHELIKENEENKKYFTEEEWKDVQIFYRQCCYDPNGILNIDYSEFVPDINEVIEVIHNAGGKAFLAHLFRYKETEKEAKDLLNNIVKNTKIDGIECFYKCFTKEQQLFLANFCKNNNLLISGGSDYHGENKKNIKLGIDIPKEFTNFIDLLTEKS